MLYYFERLCQNELKKILIQLINQGFPKDKMIIHSDTALLEELNLSRIHFKENVKTAFAYKNHIQKSKWVCPHIA